MDISRDDKLYDILSDSGQIIQFFESIFGFLYRRTDFFKVQQNPDEEFGFPAGIAESLVLKIFKQWENLANQDEILERLNRLKSDGIAPPACQELEVTESTQDQVETEKKSTVKKNKSQSLEKETVSKNTRLQDESSEGFNGAVREGYSWSQSISDVDIDVDVPVEVVRAKQVTVDITAFGLKVSLTGQSEHLVQGDFPWRTKKEEAVWSLVPGKNIQVHLEKSDERWWDCIFTSEPKIDVQKIDPSRPIEEFSQSDQMKVQQLVWDKERRDQGCPTVSQSVGPEEMLRQAWHQEGSPFKDMPFDPSVVQFQQSSSSHPSQSS